MTHDALRIGDAEREQASTALGEHLAQGRLGVDEHAERLDAVWSARTRGDLVPVFADLPAPHPAALTAASAALQSEPDRSTARSGYWSTGPALAHRGRRGARPGPLPVVLALLLVLTVATHLPFLLLGLVAVLFVTARHRRWSHRHW